MSTEYITNNLLDLLKGSLSNEDIITYFIDFWREIHDCKMGKTRRKSRETNS